MVLRRSCRFQILFPASSPSKNILVEAMLKTQVRPQSTVEEEALNKLMSALNNKKNNNNSNQNYRNQRPNNNNQQNQDGTKITLLQQQQQQHQQQQKQVEQIKNLERKLSQMSNDEFSSRHLDGLMRLNVSKLAPWVLQVTLNEAERRITVLPQKAVRDILILSSNASRHNDRQTVLQKQQQNQNLHANKDNSSLQQENISNNNNKNSSHCIKLFLLRAKTHSRDPTFGLLDAVVDAAYMNEKFEDLVELSKFGADKLISFPDDHPTDVSMFRVLWRVVCLGVKKLMAVRFETRRISANFLNSSPSSSSQIQQLDDKTSLEAQLKELHLKQEATELAWRSAAEDVWKNMVRCNPTLSSLNNTSSNSSDPSNNHQFTPQQTRSKFFTSLYRFVLYGASKHQQQLSSNNNNSVDSLMSSGGGGNTNENNGENNNHNLLDWGEMQCFHLWYDKKLFLCSKEQPLQLYLALIRTCRPGLWLEQSQLYFEHYQASKNNNNNNKSKSTEVHNPKELSSSSSSSPTPPKNSNKDDTGIEEILIFTLISVFQNAKDYKRICALGKNLIASAEQSATATVNAMMAHPHPQQQLYSSASLRDDLLSEAISPSVLATIAQAAGETHESNLVNQCLNLILNKFVRAAKYANNSENNNNVANFDGTSSPLPSNIKFPSTFSLYQALSAAAKSGALGFPELVDVCLKNGWVTAAEKSNESSFSSKRFNKNNNNNNNSKKLQDEDLPSLFENENAQTSPSTILENEDPAVSAADDEDGQNQNNNKNKNMNSSSSNSQMFDSEQDVRLHLILQWANACSNVHEEGDKLISLIEKEVKAAKQRALSTHQNKNNNNNNNSPNHQILIKESISAILSERCHNQILQLLHRIEHGDYLRWYRLGRTLGYQRDQWVEMLILWSDRRRYSLTDDERRYVLEEFRRSGVSESGLRPMLSLLRFDQDERPIERFNREFRGSSGIQLLRRKNKSSSSSLSSLLPSDFIDSAPGVLDPRAHFMRRGASKVTIFERKLFAGNDFNKNDLENTNLMESVSSPVLLTTNDKRYLPLTYQEGPPRIHLNFSDHNNNVAKAKASPNDENNNNNLSRKSEDASAVLLQWFLCKTLEGMQLHGNSFGIESEEHVLVPFRKKVEEAEKQLIRARGR